MKILIKYSHGLGDVIALTPQLRYFHQQGHTVDLLVRGEVVGSCLLNNCPYVRHINVIRNPWEAEDYEKVEAGNVALLETISTYDRRINVDHKDIPEDILKSKFNSIQCGITEDIDMKKEVFISDANMRHVIEEVWMGNHIMPYNFVHTLIANHPEHSWDVDWTLRNVYRGDVYRVDDKPYPNLDINYTFGMIYFAQHVVVSSSVMAIAAEALGRKIDMLNFGREDYKVLPPKHLVKHICVKGQVVNKDKFYANLKEEL